MCRNILTEEDKKLSQPGIAWKKAFCSDDNEVLVLLSFDKKTPVPNLGSFYVIKSPVRVLAIYDMWGYKTAIKETRSNWDKSFVYRVGETVNPENGIWAWPTFNQAVEYWKNINHKYDERYESVGIIKKKQEHK